MAEFNFGFPLFSLITTEDAIILYSMFIKTLSLGSIIILGIKRYMTNRPLLKAQGKQGRTKGFLSDKMLVK